MSNPRLLLPDTETETVEAGVLGVGLWKKLVASLKLLGGGKKRQIIEYKGLEVQVEAQVAGGVDVDGGRVQVRGQEMITFIGLPDTGVYRYLTSAYVITDHPYEGVYRGRAIVTSDNKILYERGMATSYSVDTALINQNVYSNHLFLPVSHYNNDKGMTSVVGFVETPLGEGEPDVVCLLDGTMTAIADIYGENGGDWADYNEVYGYFNYERTDRFETKISTKIRTYVSGYNRWQAYFTGDVTWFDDGGEEGSVKNRRFIFSNLPVRPHTCTSKGYLLSGEINVTHLNEKVTLLSDSIAARSLYGSEVFDENLAALKDKADAQLINGSVRDAGDYVFFKAGVSARVMAEIKMREIRKQQSVGATKKAFDQLLLKELPKEWQMALREAALSWIGTTPLTFKRQVTLTRTQTYVTEGNYPVRVATTSSVLSVGFSFTWPKNKALPNVQGCTLSVLEELDENTLLLKCVQEISGKRVYREATRSVTHSTYTPDFNSAGDKVYEHPYDREFFQPPVIVDGTYFQGELATTTYNGAAVEGMEGRSINVDDSSHVTPIFSTDMTYRRPAILKALFEYGEVVPYTSTNPNVANTALSELALITKMARLGVTIVLFGQVDCGMFQDGFAGGQVCVYGTLKLKFNLDSEKWTVSSWKPLPSPVPVGFNSTLPLVYHMTLGDQGASFPVDSSENDNPNTTTPFLNGLVVVKGLGHDKHNDQFVNTNYSKTEGFVGDVLRAAGVIKPKAPQT